MKSSRWSLRIVPSDGELLSGYLCRAAAAHGQSAHSFSAFHFGDSAFWARDVDGHGMRHIHVPLAEAAGLSLNQIKAMSLNTWQEVLTPVRYVLAGTGTVIPWINAAGIYHRRRRRHALQYCPRCLAEDGIVRKAWRLSFFLICPRHQVILSDGCPRCGAPFAPHRAFGRHHACHGCGLPLGGTDAVRLQHEAPADLAVLIEVQASMAGEIHDAVSAGSGSVADKLLGIRDLLSVAGLEESDGAATGVRETPRIEFSRVARRLVAVRAAGFLMMNWPVSFRTMATERRWTQTSFKHLVPLPRWLDAEVKMLAPGRTQPRRRSAREALEDRIDKIVTSHAPNWRAARAEVMLKAAGFRR